MDLSLCFACPSLGFKAETLSGRVASGSSHDPLDHIMLRVRGVNLVVHLAKVITGNRVSGRHLHVDRGSQD